MQSTKQFLEGSWNTNHGKRMRLATGARMVLGN